MFTTIEEIPHFKKAHLSRSLGNKTFNYSWKSTDVNDSQDQKETIFNFDNTFDHSYASRKLVSPHYEGDDDRDNIDFSKIFDADGNWHTQHKRHIIHVMDCF